MIGDVLTTSLLFEVLRSHYPKAQLDFLINSNTKPVVENNPYINKYWLYSKEHEVSASLKTAFRHSLKNEKYDAVIDVYAKIGSAFLTKYTGAKNRISYRKWYTRHKYTTTVVPKVSTSLNEGLAIANRVLLLEPLLGKIDSIPKPKIYLRQEEKEKAEQRLAEYGIDTEKPIYMIGILGSSKNKTYPLSSMAKILNFLVQETKGQLLFNYIPRQQSEADELIELCSTSTKKNIFKELYGKDLREFLALTSYCDALIGNEGGAVNMAKALDIPTFSIFAPWILKEAWNSYENTSKNVSVHLKDFHPELYTKHPKKYKKRAVSMYHLFDFEYITPVLQRFLLDH